MMMVNMFACRRAAQQININAVKEIQNVQLIFCQTLSNYLGATLSSRMTRDETQI